MKTSDTVRIRIRDLRKRQLLYVRDKELNRSPRPTIRLVCQVICKYMECPRQEPAVGKNTPKEEGVKKWVGGEHAEDHICLLSQNSRDVNVVNVDCRCGVHLCQELSSSLRKHRHQPAKTVIRVNEEYLAPGHPG